MALVVYQILYTLNMGLLQTVILSVIEGLTEFLPISSTGHLILVSDLLKIVQTDFVKTFEIVIQLGAILAVVILYWKPLARNFLLWKKIITAFLPAAGVGFFFYPFIKNVLIGNTVVVSLSLLFGGLGLILLEKYHNEEKGDSQKLENMTYKNALIIGFFQSISVIPGVSRAAASIAGGMLTGLSRKASVEFSFLLAMPTMFAATGLDLVKSGFNFSQHEILLLAVGFIGAFLTAIFAVKFLLSFVQKHTFVPFALYRIILAILFLSLGL